MGAKSKIEWTDFLCTISEHVEHACISRRQTCC